MNTVIDVKASRKQLLNRKSSGWSGHCPAAAKSTRQSRKTQRPNGAYSTPLRDAGIFRSHFDFMMARNFCAGSYGEGGAAGECFSTAHRIVDRDVESWTVAWSDTAERVERIAKDCLRGGHVLSAAKRSSAHRCTGDRPSSTLRPPTRDSARCTCATDRVSGRPRGSSAGDRACQYPV